jgi:hypothetical protein
MTEIDLNPDTAHSADRTATTAQVAADAIRVLNYATRDADGLPYPGDAYDLLGQMSIAVLRLHQLFDQVGVRLVHLGNTGHLASDNGAPVGVALAAALDALSRAQDDADTMATALGNAQSAIDSLRYED